MRWTIGRKLGLGFGAMIALMVAVAGLIWVQVGRSTAAQTTLLEQQLPAEVAVLKLRGSVSEALSLHRGYMILGLQPLADARLVVWKDIHKEMDRLEVLSRAWDAEQRGSLDELKRVMGDFERQQQRIADVAHAPENLPAHRMFFDEATPLADQMMAAIDRVLEAESKEPASAERITLVRRVADAKGHLLESSAAISAYLANGTDEDRARVDQCVADCQASVDRLKASAGQFSAEQKLAFEAYLGAREKFLETAKRAIAVRSESGWNQAEDLCLNTVTPLANRATDLLTAMVKAQEGALETQQGAMESANATMSSTVLIAAAAGALAGVGVAVVLTRQIVRRLTAVLARATQIAGNDLSGKPLNSSGHDEIAELTDAMNSMSEALRALISDVARASEEVAGAATEIAASSEQISAGMEEQSAQVSRVSAAIEEMSASVTEVARSASDASATAGDSGRLAQTGRETVRGSVDGMNAIAETVSTASDAVRELGRRGEQIGAIVEVINDIADQTNLLALNAAIEAARAGEHGRGFAVVADEVRKLADRTTKATEEISDSIAAIQDETNKAVDRMNGSTQQVREGVDRASEAGESLDLIVEGSGQVASMIQSIAAAAEEQAAAAGEVTQSVVSINEIARQTSEGTRQAAQAGADLASRAESLQAQVRRFRL